MSETEKIVQEASDTLAALQQQRSATIARIGTVGRDIENVDNEIHEVEAAKGDALINGDTSALAKIKKQLAALHEHRAELRDLKSALENRAAKLDLEITAAKKTLADAQRNLAREQITDAIEKYHAQLGPLCETMKEIVRLRPAASQGFQNYSFLIDLLPRELFTYDGERPTRRDQQVWNLSGELDKVNRNQSI